MPPRDRRHVRPRLERLGHDPRLGLNGPTAPAAGTRDHLEPPDLHRLRLKRKVKRRHKPIPFGIATFAGHSLQRKVGSKPRLLSTGFCHVSNDRWRMRWAEPLYLISLSRNVRRAEAEGSDDSFSALRTCLR